MASSHVDIQGTDGITAAYTRRGDCVCFVVNDPNGPLLATVATVVDWDDLGVQVDIGPILATIPWNTIRSAYKVDGNIVGPIEFDPQRPTT